MKQVDLFGYKVLENGTILKLNGEPMKYQKTIQIIWNKNEPKSVSYSRFVYYAFHQDFDFNNHSYCVKHKDNNLKNNNINNLYISDKKEYLWGENNKKSKLTDEEVKEIKEMYSIGREVNKGYELNDPKRRYSYRKIAELYGVSHNLIRQIVKEECRKSG